MLWHENFAQTHVGSKWKLYRSTPKVLKKSNVWQLHICYEWRWLKFMNYFNHFMYVAHALCKVLHVHCNVTNYTTIAVPVPYCQPAQSVCLVYPRTDEAGTSSLSPHANSFLTHCQSYQTPLSQHQHYGRRPKGTTHCTCVYTLQDHCNVPLIYNWTSPDQQCPI